MSDYRFDLMADAEKVGAPDAQDGADKSALHAALKRRPFQLFYPSTKEEVSAYVADPALRDAVNAALATGRPLLLTGEPGTGKTSAAVWVAGMLGLDMLRFQVKSNSRAQDLLYTVNSIDYFRTSQVAAAARAAAPNKGDFVEKGKFWLALEAENSPCVLLIDEIDKAPRDFPNDLLFELDSMTFLCPERQEAPIVAKEPGLRPIVMITSNSERRLPEPFLRRCIYHNIVLDEKAFRKIIDRRLTLTEAYFTADVAFRGAAEICFFRIRDIDSLQKKPSINEFWQWFVLVGTADASRKAVIDAGEKTKSLSTLPYLSTLLKNSEDIEQLARH